MKTKTLLLVVGFLSALFLTANCQHMLTAYEQIQVLTDVSNPNSCRLHLDSDVDYTSNLTNAYTNISQSYIPDPSNPSPNMPAGCAFLNIDFTSFFYNDPTHNVVNYTQPVHYNYDASGNLTSSWVNTTIFASTLAAMNGTECLYLKENQNGLDQYMCSINYGGNPIFWTAFGTGSGSNFQFASFASGRSYWELGFNHIVQGLEYGAIVDLNTSFPNVVADIYSSCGSGNRNFWSLQVQIAITTSVNLTQLLGGNFGNPILFGWIVVKKNNAAAGDYLSYATQLAPIQSGAMCWTLGVTWDKILPDMNYCANGCQVTLLWTNHPLQIFVLKTTGVKTASNLRG